MAVITRLANMQDARPLVELCERVQDALTKTGSIQQIGPLELNDVQAAITKLQCYILCPVDDQNQILGSAFIKPLAPNHFMTTAEFDMASFSRPQLFLHTVMLEPVIQGKGHGYQLVRDFMASIQERYRSGTVLLDCWAGNDKLRNFYTRAGFTFAAVIPQEDYEIAVYYMDVADGLVAV